MAIGDKKRAVMTDDINNSGSSYPVLGPTGDGSKVTAAFTAAASRTNISTGEKLSVIFGKVAKWFADLGAAAFRGVDATPTAGSTNLVESGGVKSAISKVAVRPNLLDNWYFVGGGSQQGDGIFPINQRGALTFSTANAMTIDQWQLTSGVASLASDGQIVGSGSSGTNSVVTQIIDLKALLGKTVTYTVMYDSNGTIGLETASVTLPATTPSASLTFLQLVNIPGTYRTRLSHYVAYSGKMFVQIGQTTNSSIKILAAKLELGEGQTLAHNEGTAATPVWALNAVPDFATELLRCQTRYQLFRTQSLMPTYRQDFRPVMDASSGADPDIPNTGTITIGGVTYYYASSD